jgi:hypothetical protein
MIMRCHVVVAPAVSHVSTWSLGHFILNNHFLFISGRANCPYYAKSELLADNLAKNLDDFKLHKIVIQPVEWEVSRQKKCD